MNLSDKTFFVVDDGLFPCVAERLAREGSRVLYFCPYMNAFTMPTFADVGTGLPGVQRVTRFWRDVQQFDPNADELVFVFPSVGQGDLQEELIRQGFHVWGSRSGEDLELFRADAKRIQKEVGLAVNDYQVVLGIPALRAYLADHPEQFVKVSEFRGITESFYSKAYPLVAARIDRMQAELGPLRSHNQPFIIESKIPTAIEIGGDEYTVDSLFPSKRRSFGIEIKDLCFGITHVPNADLPAPIAEINDRLAPVLKAYQYRGPFHTEIRVGKDGKNYLIDLTNRCGSPPTEIMLEWWTNFPEIIWEVAHGRMCEFKPSHQYGFEIGLYSEEAVKCEMIVQFPDEIARWVKLYYHARDKHGGHHVLNTPASDQHFGNVVGLGNTIEEAVNAMFDHAEQVEADGLHIDRTSISRLYEELREMKKKGIGFGPSPIPES